MELGFGKTGRFNRKRKKPRKTAGEPSPRSRYVATEEFAKIYQEYGMRLRPLAAKQVLDQQLVTGCFLPSVKS
jgi:hypothetical protein